MSKVDQKEIQTQQHVIWRFTNDLGYRYLGHWKDRETNANVEEELLSDWLIRRGHDRRIIGRVLFELNKARALGGAKPFTTPTGKSTASFGTA